MIATWPCAACGKPHSRYKGGGTSGRRLKTCSPECRYRSCSGHHDHPPTWPCVICGAQHSRLGAGKRRLATCSDACIRESNRRSGRKRRRPLKFCPRPGCGQPVLRHDRTYCSNGCATAMRGKVVELSVGIVPEAVTHPALLDSIIPARLRRMLDELPAAERRKAIEGWRNAA